MIINSITNTSPHRGRFIVPGAKGRGRECVKERDNLKQNNYDNINTSIKSNPDARVSFKGAPLFYKAASFTNDYPLVAEALFALVITCGLRPATIMATARSESDKDKCAYQAAKSVSSGLAGLAMTMVVGSAIGKATKESDAKGYFNMPDEMKQKSTEIVQKGVDTLKQISTNLENNNPLSQLINNVTKDNNINFEVFSKKGENTVDNFKKSIKQIAPDSYEVINKAMGEQKVINNYQNTAKNVANRIFQPVFMPLRAMVTIAAIPVLLKSLGFKKPDNKENNSQSSMYSIINEDMFYDEHEKILFQPFSGAVKHENK